MEKPSDGTGVPPRGKEPQGEARPTSAVVRHLLIAAGFVCVGLGFAGIFIPLLPTTPFLLLAAACFARSSERFHHWLLTNRWVGRRISDYVEHRATTLATKIGSITMLWCCLAAAGVFFTGSWIARGALAVIGIGVTIHLLSLRTISRSGAPPQSREVQDGAREGLVRSGRRRADEPGAGR